MSQGRVAHLRPYELIDVPSGEVLATADWYDRLMRGPVREMLEREGRQRAYTLMVRGGYYYDDTGEPVDDDGNIRTGDRLAAFALGEPYRLSHEPSIGLDPHPFTDEEYLAIPDIKFEMLEGGLFDDGQGRATVMRALLANMGLREVLKLAPRELWLAALDASD
jgi:hypothetical protein